MSPSRMGFGDGKRGLSTQQVGEPRSEKAAGGGTEAAETTATAPRRAGPSEALEALRDGERGPTPDGAAGGRMI